MKPKKIPLDDLVLDDRNRRKHPARNLETIRLSLARFGQQSPIVVAAGGVVVKGNGTVLAARELGWAEIWAIETPLDGSTLRAYAIADNRTSELAAWDELGLIADLRELLDADPDLLNAAGFAKEELDLLVKRFEREAPEAFEERDRYEGSHRCPKCTYEWTGACKP